MNKGDKMYHELELYDARDICFRSELVKIIGKKNSTRFYNELDKFFDVGDEFILYSKLGHINSEKTCVEKIVNITKSSVLLEVKSNRLLNFLNQCELVNILYY